MLIAKMCAGGKLVYNLTWHISGNFGLHHTAALGTLYWRLYADGATFAIETTTLLYVIEYLCLLPCMFNLLRIYNQTSGFHLLQIQMRTAQK